MDTLIKNINRLYEEGKTDAEDFKRILDEYISNREDWQQFAFTDPHKYTRNLVDRGNGKYNLLILCWPQGMGSAIHDHSKSHCFVKILAGNLKETLYNWPKDKGNEMIKTKESIYGTNDVTYMSDELGLHRMENPSHTDICVSLHLYTPPFGSCHVFDERTGQDTEAPMVFFSEYGQKMEVN